MLIRAIIFVLALAPSVGSAQMTFFSGNQLMEDCNKPGNVSAGAYNSCVMYLAGVHDGHLTLVANRKGSKPLICTPASATLRQIRQVFLNHMKNNPRDRHQAAAGLALTAFEKAWPCK